MAYLKRIRITKIEERSEDAWIDMSLRQLRVGVVRFYRVKDFLTGEWIFKICSDKELGKVIVKAIKCPPGKRFSQLEGNAMLFQNSIIEGFLYDGISIINPMDSPGTTLKAIRPRTKIKMKSIM